MTMLWESEHSFGTFRPPHVWSTRDNAIAIVSQACSFLNYRKLLNILPYIYNVFR